MAASLVAVCLCIQSETVTITLYFIICRGPVWARSTDPVEPVPAGFLAGWLAGCLALSGKFVRACTENLVNRFWCEFYCCLLLWSSCAIFKMKEIGSPLHGFGGAKILSNDYKLRRVNCLRCLLLHNSCFPDHDHQLLPKSKLFCNNCY